jgi:hypothetical protein
LRHRKYTAAQFEEAAELYRSGLSFKAISKRVGISWAQIRKVLIGVHGITPRGVSFYKRGKKTKPCAPETRKKISDAHKSSGHRPTPEACAKGRPKTVISRKLKTPYDPIGRWLQTYIRGAEARDFPFLLTRKVFENLVTRPCTYCKAPPQERRLLDNKTIVAHVHGIDRVDSSKGYFEDNCVPCCTTCNRMKLTMTVEAFLEHCRKVSKNALN